MWETLLLTWTIKPDSTLISQWYTSSTLNADERYFQYIDTLLYYITQSNFANIVFCENSNSSLKEEYIDMLHKLSIRYNKNLELLYFTGNTQKTLELWYGYWDSECIDFAYNNARLLKQAQNWYKISGRYKCTNINTLIEEHKNESVYFFKWVNRSIFSVCTALFKCNNDFYKKHLYNIYTTSPLLSKWHKSIESLYYDILRIFFKSRMCGQTISFPTFSRGSNMITITPLQKIVLWLWLSDIWSWLSFIVDKLLYKNE